MSNSVKFTALALVLAGFATQPLLASAESGEGSSSGSSSDSSFSAKLAAGESAESPDGKIKVSVKNNEGGSRSGGSGASGTYSFKLSCNGGEPVTKTNADGSVSVTCSVKKS